MHMDAGTDWMKDFYQSEGSKMVCWALSLRLSHCLATSSHVAWDVKKTSVLELLQMFHIAKY